MHVKSSKLINKDDFIVLRKKIKEEKKKISLCHGVFDLLHPGHILHLEEAKSKADLLVVSITAKPYVNRGPDRPFFSDELRLKSLAALECVDYVMLVNATTAIEVIEIVQPDFYVKGKEYSVSEDDVTGNIDSEVEKVRLHGGEVYFTQGEVFSSTKLLNQSFAVFPPKVKDYMQNFVQKYNFEQIKKTLDLLSDLKVLVIGDIIIDEYVFCKIQGLTSKDRTFSAKYEKEETYLGGVLAIARHIANLSNHVTVTGIMGNETYFHTKILNDLSPKMKIDLHFDDDFRTVVKRRFVEKRGIRDEYDKILSINYLQNDAVKFDKQEQLVRELFLQKLTKEIQKYDVVVVADYGHGLIDNEVMECIQNKAKFLAINCQTNSSNLGMNLITKYRKADTFVVDERELKLAFANKRAENECLLKELKAKLKAKTSWVTLGSVGSICYNKDDDFVITPALTLNVQDTVGAGDAFYSFASLLSVLDIDIEINSFISNIAGAIASNILGNSHSVKKEAVLKFATTLMKI